MADMQQQDSTMNDSDRAERGDMQRNAGSNTDRSGEMTRKGNEARKDNK